MVTLFISCITALNQLEVRFGLKALRNTTRTGSALAAPGVSAADSSCVSVWRRKLAPLPACATAVASTRICSVAARPARRSRSKSGGIVSTRIASPARWAAAASAAVIGTGSAKSGGRIASLSRADSGLRSSSTMAVAR